ncbi:MAG: hypothetical protein ACOX2G_07560 [Bacillota bacterium]|jgi:hypothetical protein
MKSGRFKTKLFLLCCTSFLLLIVLNLWIDEFYLLESAKVLPLLAALLLSLGLYFSSTLIREKTPPKPSDGTIKAPSTFIGLAVKQGEALFPYLKVWTRLLIMGITWSIAYRVNLWLSLLLLSLAPLDILCRKLLYQELISLSGRTFSAFQEIAAFQQYRHFVPATPPKYAPVCSRVLHWSSKLTKVASAVLALADFVRRDFDPLLPALYLVILPLFFSCLGETVYGNLCRGDLINSIKYLKKVHGERKLNSCQ